MPGDLSLAHRTNVKDQKERTESRRLSVAWSITFTMVCTCMRAHMHSNTCARTHKYVVHIYTIIIVYTSNRQV